MAAQAIDAGALMAYLTDAPGAQKVQDALERAVRRDSHVLLDEVNLAESVHLIVRRGGEALWREVRRNLESLPIVIVPTTRHMAERAGNLRSQHRLGLPEAFALAHAIEHKLELLTASREMSAVAGSARVTVLT